ncbi:DUF1062 domain-containing protein [Citrobacter amalonaticus]|uniref:DUF1062 domain-containing protein n=1 Tax=Citrobacter amalonaticus TaxID=35703 RepID=UPI00115C2047|nr:DUF1062 domain-containing protein [Citrobacter amalonaticus]MBJ8734900.1 DUF1062 domain-containing protein [Citrobacter amalonaticus]MCX3397089.1 DUF1062 domain-containing protein [Citrobacter amalonaticus]MDQ2176436.1 DUF1062 domain-containing protein [Citrobacter amalonaticus]QDK86823.1 DUF1062 domain-containing protein [Citrobacter amalonaticus]UBI18654.1 DUF1062 domain-containing protein [Citrobacter amalonaticus]
MHVTWTVSPVGYQRIAKRCPACNIKRDFIPSGAFRMNSQKKLLDVWSIYKCLHCDYTWNINLFSRLPVSRIDRDLFARIVGNDASAILLFAHDRQVLKRNNAELSGSPEFAVREQWRMTLARHQQVKVTIRLTTAFQVSLLSVMKKQLRLSTGEVARRIAEGKIRGITLRELKNRKIHETTHEFWMSPDAFYATRKIYIGVKR